MSEASLPQFSSLDIANFVKQLDAQLQNNLSTISQRLSQHQHFTWENLMQPLEEMDNELERFWSPLSHLHSVVDSPSLRDCYQACLPKLSAYEAAIGHNFSLYQAIKSINTDNLNSIQKKIIEDTLRDFELSGVALELEKKKRFEAIQTRLSDLSNQFENNVLDSGQAFSLHITEEEKISGLPEHAVHAARELAKAKELPGWIINLEYPSYLAVVTYADDRRLREQIYQAYVTRASEQGPSAGQFDNTHIMDEMLALRHEKANLLGFANYAELSLATKMAKTADDVIQFLQDLGQRAYVQAKEEFNALQSFASSHYQIDKIEPWDIAYISEKKCQEQYAISQETLRPYFSLNKVMDGLFSTIKTLYGMALNEINGIDIWHPEVKCYSVTDEKNELRGYIYIDLFARQHKHGGAWMDSLQTRRKQADGSIQFPVATLTCNFAKPAGNKIATLSHDEVLTLFHEFGHCLHHVLTQVDYLSASGINGVEWDAVELPSQFFENWCWEHEALKRLTEHAETKEMMPDALFEKMLAAKNFQSAMAMMRQLEFSLFDFRIHLEYIHQENGFIEKVLKEVRQQTTVVPIASYNRFQHSFTHIFGGGYAAGYYSYKWAEVLSSDAFSRFEQEGIFNEKTGRDFLHNILEVGGGRKAKDSYLAFRGRPATVDALLRHNGIQ